MEDNTLKWYDLLFSLTPITFLKTNKKNTCLSEFLFHHFVLSLFGIKNNLFLKIFLHFLAFFRIITTNFFDLTSFLEIRIFFVKLNSLTSFEIKNRFISFLLFNRYFLLSFCPSSYFFIFTSTSVSSLLLSASTSYSFVSRITLIFVMFFMFSFRIRSRSRVFSSVLFFFFGISAS